LFIPVALAVTLVLRLALPITAGMVVAAVVLMPGGRDPEYPPLGADVPDGHVQRHVVQALPKQCLQLASSGYAKYIADPGFRRYNHFMNASRIVAAYASVPYWRWLGLA
jgi:DASS family divalent anion:Na+ symporter